MATAGSSTVIFSVPSVIHDLLEDKPFLIDSTVARDAHESTTSLLQCMFFGKQQTRGGRRDNPNTRSFMYNTQAIRVQRSMAIGHGENVRKRSQKWCTDLDDLSIIIL